MPLPLLAGTAAINGAADCDYSACASGGDAAQPLGCEGACNFADREIWRRLDSRLEQLAADGRRSLRLLDVGCGPGTWFRRVVLSAREFGFTDIDVQAFDLWPGMLALAAANAGAISQPGTRVTLSTRDIAQGLAFPDDHFDIVVCLYGVLNHLRVSAHREAAAELTRVSLGTLFVMVRTTSSLPKIYIDEIKQARARHQDSVANWMNADLTDGRHLAFPSHLFTASELSALFRPYLATTTMFGLDLFHSWFARNTDWNPWSPARDVAFENSLRELEDRYASHPHFIDRASHLLLIGEKRVL